MSSPEQLAHRLVSGTHLEDAKVREELYNGGESAVTASQDPMIQFVAKINDDLLAVRKESESRVDADRAAAEKIAKGRFGLLERASSGCSVYAAAQLWDSEWLWRRGGQVCTALHKYWRAVRAGDGAPPVGGPPVG